MQEKDSLKNSKNFIIYKKYLSFAGFFHFLVDFLPISVLYFFYKNDADFGVLIVVYNLLAFATQPFLGYIVDKLENKNFYTSVLSIFMSLIGAVLADTTFLSIVFLGLGNALFHVSFAKTVLKNARSNFPLGFFISFGVLGLGLGFTFYSKLLINLFIVIGFLTLIFFFATCRNAKIERNYSDDTEIKNRKLIIPLFILVIISISLRAGIGKVTPSIELLYSYLIVCIVSFMGKMCGGLFNRKFALIISLILSTCSLFFINQDIFTIIFIFSINLLMPTTLDYLRKIFNNYEAFSLGLSAFFLLVPIYLIMMFDAIDKKLLFVIFVSIHLLILLILIIFEKFFMKKEA